MKPTATAQAHALVGDVIDFALSSDRWKGAFGFVTFRLHRGMVAGRDVYFIRTDASDQAYASQEKLVFVPKLGHLASAGLTGLSARANFSTHQM